MIKLCITCSHPPLCPTTRTRLTTGSTSAGSSVIGEGKSVFECQRGMGKRLTILSDILVYASICRLGQTSFIKVCDIKD